MRKYTLRTIDRPTLEAEYATMSLTQMGLKYGVSYQAVQRHLKGLGIPLRSRGGDPRRFTQTVTTTMPLVVPTGHASLIITGHHRRA